MSNMSEKKIKIIKSIILKLYLLEKSQPEKAMKIKNLIANIKNIAD